MSSAGQELLPTGSPSTSIAAEATGAGFGGPSGAWRVETSRLPVHVVDDRLIAGAMCGNELAWVRAGRFSDGRHREVAFMLWTDPSIGATTKTEESFC